MARRGEQVLAQLLSEELPQLDGHQQDRLIQFVNFSRDAIAKHRAEWAQVKREERDIFDDRHVRAATLDDLLILANLRPNATATGSRTSWTCSQR